LCDGSPSNAKQKKKETRRGGKTFSREAKIQKRIVRKIQLINHELFSSLLFWMGIKDEEEQWRA
jgi:hypothetical protein